MSATNRGERGEGSVDEVLAGVARWCVVHEPDERGCLLVLPTIPEKSVDHTITDPPYRASLYRNTRTNAGHSPRPNDQRTAMAWAERRIGTIDDIMAPVGSELQRVTRRWMIVYHDAESGHLWRAALGGEDEETGTYVRTGMWAKDNPMPQISADRPGQAFELCTIAHARPRGRMRWNGGGRGGRWDHPTCQGPDRPEHPSPKPLDLMLEQVADFTDPGELVLDVFAGSGTTGVACLRLDRRVILVERDAEFAHLARERMRAEERGIPLRATMEDRRGQLPLLAGV